MEMLEINADLSRRAVVETAALPWVASPSAAVERRMIERRGGEVARATSIVRYAPNSRFSAHRHGGGEELFVLSGTFSDRSGDFPAGAYVRNPVGSGHAPRSETGCTIFVKLWWMHAADQEVVRIDTTDAGLWRPAGGDGVETLPLHRFGEEETALFRLAPGAALPPRDAPGGEEILVLAGTCADALGRYGPLAWLRQPPGALPALAAEAGATLLVKRGHLLHPPPLPPGSEAGAADS